MAACRWLMIRMRSRTSRRTLPTKRSAIALARGARTGVFDDADADRGEHGVERGGELGVAVPEEEPEPPAGGVEVHEQVAGQLGQPSAGRLGGDAQDVHAAARVLDDKERIHPAQGDRVEVKHVAGQDACAWAFKNSLHDGPAHRGEGSIPARCRMAQTVEAPIR